MQNIKEARNPYHPDVAIFLTIIPLISAFNYYLTYSNIQLSWFLLLTFIIDTAQGYLAWWGVRSFIFYLDRRIPHESGVRFRLIIQVFTTLVIGLVIIAVLTEITSLIAKGEMAPLSFYTVDLFIISIWFFVINGIYIGLRYFNLWKTSEERRLEEMKLKSNGVMVKQGKQELRFTFEELAGFCVEGEYSLAVHNSGKKYYLDQSLDKLEKTLPSTLFFRLNRQFILHRERITGFKRADNGKIIVQAGPMENVPSEILVSRTKAPAFKRWFRPD